MKANKCRCGEPLITLDEIKRRSCWDCQGMVWRLGAMDRELETLERRARLAWEIVTPAGRLAMAFRG